MPLCYDTYTIYTYKQPVWNRHRRLFLGLTASQFHMQEHNHNFIICCTFWSNRIALHHPIRTTSTFPMVLHGTLPNSHICTHTYTTLTHTCDIHVYDEWICLGFLYEKSHWNRQWWSRRRMNHHHTFAYTMLTFTTHSHCMQVQTTGAVVGWSSKQTHIYIYRNICILKYTRTHTHALVCIRTGRERELESSQF